MKNLIERLQQEAKSSAVFNSIAHVFAMRKRTRQQVTIHNLMMVMAKEGFDFTREQYEGVLKFMADVGLGTLTKTPRGRVRALKGITYTLQSIGKAALAQSKSVEKSSIAVRFTEIPTSEVEKVHRKDFIEKKKPKAKAKSIPVRETRYPTFLTVLIEGKPVNFSGPSNITADNLADFLGDFKRMTDKDDV